MFVTDSLRLYGAAGQAGAGVVTELQVGSYDVGPLKGADRENARQTVRLGTDEQLIGDARAGTCQAD